MLKMVRIKKLKIKKKVFLKNLSSDLNTYKHIHTNT